MNKTTSFSKILANKSGANNTIMSNNNDSFFLDSLKDENKIQSLMTNGNGGGGQEMVDEESAVGSGPADEDQLQLHNYIGAGLGEDDDEENDEDDEEYDFNLDDIVNTNQLQFSDHNNLYNILNHHHNSNANRDDEDDYDDEDDDDDEDVDEDHHNNIYDASHHHQQLLQQQQYLNNLNNNNNQTSNNNTKNNINRRLLLNNYDIYKLTKKNYKLTFNKNNNNNSNGGGGGGVAGMGTSGRTNVTYNNNNNSSITSSVPLQNSYTNQYENNDDYNRNIEEHVDDDEFYDEEDDDNIDEDDYNHHHHHHQLHNYHQQQPNHNYYARIGHNYNQTYQVPSNLIDSTNIDNESIMNWSMKISNYNGGNSNTNTTNTNNRRSQSRSPVLSSQQSFMNTNIPRSASSSQYFYQQHQQFQHLIDAPLQFQNIKPVPPPPPLLNHQQKYNHIIMNEEDQEQQRKRLSTTSWGKLKHSKSSSSNIGVSSSINSSSSQQYPNQSNNMPIDDLNCINQVSFIQSYQNKYATNQEPNYLGPVPSISSPSLFKLFQNSKTPNCSKNFKQQANLVDSTSSISPRQSRKNNQVIHQQQKQLQQQQQAKQQPYVKTTSFSQMRQRSSSSCALVAQEDKLPPEHEMIVICNKQKNSQNVKKSIGIQHPPREHMDQSIQTSTIVCMVVDRNHKTTNKEIMAAARAARAAVAARRSNSLFHTKSSLPDLTFLRDYADDFSRPKHQQQQQHQKPQQPASAINNKTKVAIINNQSQPVNNNNIPIVGSDLLKRKTLKSIKRYRQTKQNTEPCALVNAPQPPADNLFDQYYNKQPVVNNIKDRKSISHQQNLFDPNQHQILHRQSSLTAHTEQGRQSQQKQPLKSCLKRKDSTQRSNTTNCAPVSAQIRKPQNGATSLIVGKIDNSSATSSSNTTANSNLNQSLLTDSSIIMFVPYVGYLFTCDHESSNRYQYYNNLERNRRIKIYRQLIKQANRDKLQDEEDEEEEEEDEEDEDEDENDEEIKNVFSLNHNKKSDRSNKLSSSSKPVCTSSRSDNDLRVKKTVKFYSNVDQIKRSSTKSENVPSTVDTPVSNSSATPVQPNANTPTNSAPNSNASTAPLLQYDALIAMLKSGAAQKTSVKEPNPARFAMNNIDFSPQLIKKKLNSQAGKTSNNAINSIKNKTHDNYFKKSQIIDTDSISLASLSESPPSEFKFSDDEDEHSNPIDHLQHIDDNLNNLSLNFNMMNEKINKLQQLNGVGSSSANTKKQASFSSSSSSSSGSSTSSSSITNNTNKQLLNNENNKNQNQLNQQQQQQQQQNLYQQQQMKINQLNQIRNRKKNFHAILLKDTKLNNLKEILLEIKQLQQKMLLAAQQKYDNTAQGFTSSSSSSSSTSGNSSTSNHQQQIRLLSTINSPNNITSNNELKETIERLSQYLFEFLKQGLKPTSTDTTVSPTGPKSPTVVDSPSASINRQQLLESNTLSLTYSQYTQLWNLIESTMNYNLSQNEQQPQQQQQSQPQSDKSFKLPKEAYLNMFQEINRYANNTNQTYLIDSGINTSQLRRKHHFMVMLMSLKFKFQLFIVNLLNYKQLANWFEYLNKDKSVLKTYYDLKSITNSTSSNNNGDSGVGEFMCASTSSSTTSSSLFNFIQNTNTNQALDTIAGNNLLASLSITSLANVSIFENDEYFNYFHKLLQQFNFIDFNLNIFNSQQSSPSTSTHLTSNHQQQPSISSTNSNDHKNPSNNNNNKPTIPFRKANSRRNSNSAQQQLQQYSTLTMSPSHTLNNNNNNINQNYQIQSTNGSGFNLKNISKRFNIKSWFTSSSSSSNISANSPGSYVSTLPASGNSTVRSSSGIGIVKSLLPSTSSVNNKLYAAQQPQITGHKSNKTVKNYNHQNMMMNPSNNAGGGIVGSGIGVLANKNENLMKHSLSEPSLNSLIN